MHHAHHTAAAGAAIFVQAVPAFALKTACGFMAGQNRAVLFYGVILNGFKSSANFVTQAFKPLAGWFSKGLVGRNISGVGGRH